MFYFTGITWVPNDMQGNNYLPGAVGDNLTSFGGVLNGTEQTSILDLTPSGLTGSFGTVSEPCADPNKFTDPRIMIQHYSRGDTLVEAYWKSLAVTFQGLFVGEPLAAPYK